MNLLDDAAQFWLHMVYLQQTTRRRSEGVYRTADISVRNCSHCQCGKDGSVREYHHCDTAGVIVHRRDSCMKFVFESEDDMKPQP